MLPWSLECDFRLLRYLRRFVFLTTEVLPEVQGFLTLLNLVADKQRNGNSTQL